MLLVLRSHIKHINALYGHSTQFLKLNMVVNKVTTGPQKVDSTPFAPILSQINPIHNIPSLLRCILILIYQLRLGLPSGLFPSGFPTKILVHFIPPPYVPYTSAFSPSFLCSSLYYSSSQFIKLFLS